MASDILAGGFSISGNTASGNATQNNYNIFRDNIINLSGGENVQQLRSRFLQWLAAPDVSFNHHEARLRHVYGTGEWLLQSESYRAWATGELPHLWLKGGPGTGKTILCSSTIEAIRDQVKGNKAGVVIYHYFSFSSHEKHTYQGLLLSLISQLVDKSTRLDHMRNACDKNQRHPILLVIILLEMLDEYDRIFIVLDALDECPMERGERDEILAGIADLLTRGSGIHVLVTSRPEPDIALLLGDMAFYELDFHQSKDNVASDIDVVIRKTMDDAPKLRGLPLELREEIRQTLGAKAGGMFRWVACQLDVLRRKKILNHDVVRKVLENLPDGLDETYNRILVEIEKDEEMAFDARTILQWIMFHHEDFNYLTSPDLKALLIDVCLFNRQHRCTLQREERSTMAIVFEHLSPLVRIEWMNGTFRVELAHFTVQEYLLSNRIKAGVASSFALSESGCHRNIAYTCIKYSLSGLDPEEMWLDCYAHRFWMYHESEAQLVLPAGSFDGSATKLLLKLAEKEVAGEGNLEPDPTLRALCLAASYGLCITVSCMLENCADINDQDPEFGTALQAACHGDSAAHLAVIKLLKQAGSDVNTGGGKRGSPLHTAIAAGSSNTVKELLLLGADPNTMHPIHGAPFHQLCSAQGAFLNRRIDERIATDLVSAGANINARNSRGETALALVCSEVRHSWNFIEDLEIVLRHGPEVNATDELGNTALHQACKWMDAPSAVKLLIQAGADVQAVNSQEETPLHVLCLYIFNKYVCGETVKVLLDAGADPNARRQDGATPLHLLCNSDHGASGAIDLLLSAGAEMNAIWPLHGSPWQVAIARGTRSTILALLGNGVAMDMGSLWGFRHQSGGREHSEEFRKVHDKLSRNQIRVHMCTALLKPDADSSPFRSICGPPSLDNLLRWFFEVGADTAGLLELINRGVDKALLLCVLQAGVETTLEHLRSYLERIRGPFERIDHDVVRAFLQTGIQPDMHLMLFVVTKEPSLVEMFLEAGTSVDDVLMNKVREFFDSEVSNLGRDGLSRVPAGRDIASMLQDRQTEVLEILRKAQEAQRQGQKYVPMCETDSD